MTEITKGALVFYKNKAAVVTGVSDKIDITFLKVNKRVRDKDITFLHPGAVGDINSLDNSVPSSLNTINDTLELLEGEAVNLEDLAELLFGSFTVQSALSTWLLVLDNLYFEGDVTAIKARPSDEIALELHKRTEKQQKQQQWDDLLIRIKENNITENDYPQLVEVEQLACGEREASKLLKALGINQNKEAAHTLLIKLGYWQETANPWPRRFGVTLSNPCLDVPDAITESDDLPREDLTHLKAWAIDDKGNKDPDDAISIEGNKLWVHIADVSSIVTPDSELDIDARSRGANLYLPNQITHMLPAEITAQCGLGLQEQNKALSISFIINDNGQLENIELCFSLIKVIRVTYEDADNEIDSTFKAFKELTDIYNQRRIANNASQLDFPEVNISVENKQVTISAYKRSGSRQIVAESMLAAGEATALFAIQNDIPIPFASQPEPEEIKTTVKLSEHYAYRRLFKPSNHTTSASSHFGLGLDCYTRVTSPIRRYLDLVVHQQIRAFLAKQPLLDINALVERIGLADEASFPLRRAERFSRQFWTLMYLKQNPTWQGDAIIVAVDERRISIILPELAYEARLPNRGGEVELDSILNVAVKSVDLIDLRANFKVLD